MKILKIFGVVVGIHVFALVLIFANPGCSSPNKAAPVAADTATPTDDNTVSRVTPDNVTPVTIARGEPPVSSVPSSFDPNATATPTIRFSPTRPGTPTATALEAAPVGDVTPATTYTVVKGDSLWVIAKKHHITVAEVAAANNLRTSTPVRIGQKLIIPSRSPSMIPAAAPDRTPSPKPVATVAPTSRKGESVTHTVRSGETLGAIARKYQVKLGDIATANNIADPKKIRPGMELIIPGWQAPKSSKSNAAKPAAEPSNTPATALEAMPTTPATSSLIIPAPEDNSGVVTPAPATEPPVIKVDDKP